LAFGLVPVAALAAPIVILPLVAFFSNLVARRPRMG
jgi:hypothetical protein